MANNIIQWNINGMTHKIPFLNKVISDKNPLVLCIQETHFKDNYYKNLKNYECYYRNRCQVTKACGGVATYINQNLKAFKIPITTNLEIVAVTVQINNKSLTIANFYLPNSQSINQFELQNVIDQLPKPFLLLGDFNCHNTIWGSNYTDSRGHMIEDIIDINNLVILNNGSPTHFNAANASTSIIDLSICTTSLAEIFDWNVADYLFCSDHYQINISFLNLQTSPPIFTPRWKFKKANWEKFQNIVSSKISELSSTEDHLLTIDELVQQLNTIILTSAKESIPQTTNKEEKHNRKIRSYKKDTGKKRKISC